jgi:hypothetical protein
MALDRQSKVFNPSPSSRDPSSELHECMSSGVFYQPPKSDPNPPSRRADVQIDVIDRQTR